MIEREKVYRTLAVTAALSAMLSCKADSNPIEPQAPNTPALSIAPAQPSKAQVLAFATKLAAVNALTVVYAKHDPAAGIGMAVVCSDGAEVTGTPGTSDPFQLQNGASRGCEMNTTGHPDGNAFVAPLNDNIRGQKLTHVKDLNFDFAGGPAGPGSPRWSIPVDENGDGTFANDATEQYAFVDLFTCTGGDAYVGRVRAEDDTTCPLTYKGITYANFHDFKAVFLNSRVGGHFPAPNETLNADPFVVIDPSAGPGGQHYLIFRFKVDHS